MGVHRRQQQRRHADGVRPGLGGAARAAVCCAQGRGGMHGGRAKRAVLADRRHGLPGVDARSHPVPVYPLHPAPVYTLHPVPVYPLNPIP
eukprot:76713-Chlamydomonas_euryale.AAC.1